MHEHGDSQKDPIKVSFVELPDGVQDWPLVTAYMRFRKEVFLDEKRWDLNHHNGMEYEQYDTFDTVYAVAHRNGQVLGGGRLRRTDKTNGSGSHTYSYMIRDAWRGMLPALPAGMCTDEPPVDRAVWELTRFATARDPEIAQTLIFHINRFLSQRGASHCLFLGPPAFMRMAQRMGWEPQHLGPVTGNEDGRFVAISCRVAN